MTSLGFRERVRKPGGDRGPGAEGEGGSGEW